MSTWTNWSRLETAHPAREATPADADAVAEEVRRAAESGGTVKMVGTGHSFTGIAVTDGTLLRPGALTGITAVDRDAMTVTARAGTRLKDLNADLERLGLSLHNMGDIAEQTLAGAVSTGTHGTGGRAAGLAAQVVGLELVTGKGELLRASAQENPDVLEHARVGLGALGVLTSLTFRVEPLFVLEADEEPVRWEQGVDGYEELAASADHLDLYWMPHTDWMLAKRNHRRGTDLALAQPPSRVARWVNDDLLENTALGAVTGLSARVPALTRPLNRTVARFFSGRRYSDVAHRVFTAERRLVFREMEYAVPRAAGPEVLRECRRVLEASDLVLGLPVEIRSAPADDVPLSTGGGRDSFYLAFHVHRVTDHRPVFALLEPVLRAHDGRPHWGKLHTRTAADLAPAYPRFEDFLALRERLDPQRVFANDYLRRVLGD